MIASARALFLAALLALGGPAARAASGPAVEAENGMVVSSQRLASQVGADILKAGGNAVDAAVAVAYAEAVVNPCCGNLGGGGFLVLHSAAGQSRFVNFRETAPAAASRDMYLDASGNVVKGASLRGWKAAGVPGTVLGLNTALAAYGTLPLAQVMAPAIAARPGRVRADAGRHRHPRIRHGAVRRSGERRPRVPAPGRQPLAARGPAGPGRPRPHPPGHRRPRLGRVLQGGDPPRRGGGVAGGRRPAHGGRLRRLHGDAVRAADLPLPGRHHPVGAPALVGRHHAVRDPRHPRRLRPAGGGVQLRPERAPDGRGDAARLCRPQPAARRPGLRGQPGRPAPVARPTRSSSGPRSGRTGRPPRPRSARIPAGRRASGPRPPTSR